MPVNSESCRSLFIEGMRDAHAVERQALALMRPQVACLENDPEMADQLRRHIAETERQVERLERLLEASGPREPKAKDAALSAPAGMVAVSRSFAGDEILKIAFANHAFENYEIAVYRSLIALGEATGTRATFLLEQSLGEERRMAEWLHANIPKITLRYAALKDAGAFAKV